MVWKVREAKILFEEKKEKRILGLFNLAYFFYYFCENAEARRDKNSFEINKEKF